ncbi:hypothetical protein TWF730_010969 [Orbilia blumenaviensis]|uniref:Uncharacterized protein n=1 Tax=Orbilia blumenaviensis TaxID=1796055 RepID=A0AAV9UMP9_9PEZI
MVGSSSRIPPTGGYSDRRLVDEVGDDEDDSEFYAGLGFPTAAAAVAAVAETGKSGDVSGGGPKVVLAGKRVIEVDEEEEAVGLSLRKRVRVALRKVRISDDDDRDDNGGGSGDDNDSDDNGDGVEGMNVEGMDVDSASEPEEVLEVPTTLGKGNPRRRFYFEDAYSSEESGGEESEEEEEPTALLSILRHKEAAKTHRQLRRAAEKDASIPMPENKKSRGKTLAVINDPYRELLNEAIRDARTRTVYPEERFFKSVVCGVPWSSGEKERFFRALPRVGGHNAVQLAEEVRTKSVIEVQGYLDALKRGLERRLMGNQRTRFELLLGEDIPAAVEVGEECEKALDDEAGRMRGFLEKLDEKEAEKKAGASVTLDMLLEVEGKEDGEEATTEGLFDLPTWLKLSERIYMASGYDEKLGRSAIHKQTLEDLKTLVESVTRRVLHITLFQANSRLEKVPSHHKEAREVTPKDVLAALRMLGMPLTSEEYWRRLPRKLGLRILGDAAAKRGEKAEFLEYDMVEEELKVFEDIGFYTDSVKKRKGRRKDGAEGEGWETDEEDEVNYTQGDLDGGEDWSDSQSNYDDDDDDDDDDENDEEDDDEEGEGGEETSEKEGLKNGNRRMTASEMANYLDTPIHLESFLHTPPIKPLKPRQRKDILDELHYINKDEKYLNAIDKFHSRLEERRLWKILGGWKDKKERIEQEIKDTDKGIPEEPDLRVFRRLERWKRGDWRQESSPMIPIWKQEYYGKLFSQERAVRVKEETLENERNTASDNNSMDSEDDSGASEKEDGESLSESGQVFINSVLF